MITCRRRIVPANADVLGLLQFPPSSAGAHLGKNKPLRANGLGWVSGFLPFVRRAAEIFFERTAGGEDLEDQDLGRGVDKPGSFAAGRGGAARCGRTRRVFRKPGRNP